MGHMIHNDPIDLSGMHFSIPSFDCEEIPDAPGIYACAVGDGSGLLEVARYRAIECRPPTPVSGAALLYVGSSERLGLRTRMLHHLHGDSRKSTLRQSIGVILARHLGLRGVAAPGRTAFHFGKGEKILSRWMQENLQFSHLCCEYPVDAERLLMQTHRPPLNIKECERSPFAQHLLALRALYLHGARRS
jgi:hypothetical protein